MNHTARTAPSGLLPGQDWPNSPHSTGTPETTADRAPATGSRTGSSLTSHTLVSLHAPPHYRQSINTSDTALGVGLTPLEPNSTKFSLTQRDLTWRFDPVTLPGSSSVGSVDRRCRSVVDDATRRRAAVARCGARATYWVSRLSCQRPPPPPTWNPTLAGRPGARFRPRRRHADAGYSGIADTDWAGGADVARPAGRWRRAQATDPAPATGEGGRGGGRESGRLQGGKASGGAAGGGGEAHCRQGDRSEAATQDTGSSLKIVGRI